MNLGQRLKSLRHDLGLSQEAIGAQGFVSTPGWIKIENGQRLPSDPLLTRLTRWLVGDSYLSNNLAERLREELLTLKYASHRSDFVRTLARAHLRHIRPTPLGGSGGSTHKVGKKKRGGSTRSVRGMTPVKRKSSSSRGAKSRGRKGMKARSLSRRR